MTVGRLHDVSELQGQPAGPVIAARRRAGPFRDQPEDAEVPAAAAISSGDWPDFSTLCQGFTYFFDLAPVSGTPKAKIYLMTRKYGHDVRTITHNLVGWMREHGHGTYREQYLGMLDKLAEHRGLENGKRMHANMSYQCTDNRQPGVKSYISPDLYHQARYHVA